MFFVLDPVKNTVADSIIPTGTSAATANVVIPTTVIVNEITSPNPIQETYKQLSNTDTTYTALMTDNTIEVQSSTYTSIYLPTTAGNPNKKLIIMRSFGGAGLLTIYPYSLVETIDGYDSLSLYHQGDLAEIVSDGQSNWRAY